jgi:diguanylate cyclase (GGDEF)-like protein
MMAGATAVRVCRERITAALVPIFLLSFLAAPASALPGAAPGQPGDPYALPPVQTPAARAVPQVLTTAAQVHDLPGDLAEKKIPVHLVATVTYYEPAERTLFVADTSGAVYVKTGRVYPLHRGDLVQIDGTTARSFRTTVAKDPEIKVIGAATLKPSKVHTYRSFQDLMGGRWDCQYVSMTGIVRSALTEVHLDSTRVLELEMLMPGGLVQAYVQNMDGIDPAKLVNAEVEISGVVGGNFNAQWELMRTVLYSAGKEDLHIIREPQVKPSSLPLTAIDDVMQTHLVNDRTQQVRVRGTVTFYRPGHSVVVQQGNRSLSASTRQVEAIPLGSLVDLVGFAEDGGYGPALGQAEIMPTGRMATIKPVPVSYGQALNGVYSDNLVALRGKLMSQLHTETSDTLLVMVDDHPVTMVLQGHPGIKRLTDIQTGSLLEVTGICRVTPAAVWGGPGTTPILFRLDLRSPDDLHILSSPSWWTVGHLVVVVGALVSLSLLIAAWAVGLRRRVAHQTATIERSMSLEKARSRVLELINSEMPLQQILMEICCSVEKLAPGLRCTYSIAALADEAIGPAHGSCMGEPLERAILETPLTDGKGRQIGSFSAGGPGRRTLSHYETEVMTIATGLANLALNQRRMYDELNYTSTHDQLTSLPNRRLSDLNLEEALEEAARAGKRVGVAYIDVDRFKQVNDQHGHKTGDLYLQQIASRLSSRVRTTDKLARIGGDEFLLIATALNSIDDAEAYRRRLEACFEHSFVLDGMRILGSASIGIAVYPDHGSDAEDLKRHADIDMYAAKHRRRTEPDHRSSPILSETSIYSPADLEMALKNEQFRLFYQPQFSGSGELRGFEALLRLEDPILGIVSPDAFIAVAERNDVILPIGAWVLKQALSDAAAWQLDKMSDVRMVVNVAARQIERPGFADEVVAALEQAGMPAHCLEVEITERTLARDFPQAARQLERLHEEGVRISIDDFGTEHSCLSALHKLPIDTLKIDMSFVRVLHTEPRVTHVIKAIVSMGENMQKRIVAEGVESEADVEALLKIGNMELQGYFFSRPQPFEKISEKLQGWRTGISIDAQADENAVARNLRPKT